jgi:hypothetical protein
MNYVFSLVYTVGKDRQIFWKSKKTSDRVGKDWQIFGKSKKTADRYLLKYIKCDELCIFINLNGR